MTERRKLVVVGNGMAGARFVEELVARGGRDAWDVTLFGDEPYGNYNRILLSSVLAGTHQPTDIFLNPLRWYTDNGVTLRAGLRVRGIDRRARVVHAGNGVMERYDALVLATGSVPFVPPLERLRLDDGAFREGAFVFRTLDDTEAMMRYAGRSKKAVIIGGGLLGLEAARGLLAMGLEVHVVHLMKHLMEVQLDPAAGRMLERLLKGMGMHVHLARATCGVIGEERVQGLLFADGLTLDSDMLVIAAGIRPNVQLAVDAGIEVERGIVVGDDLATSDANVFALGECAQHRGVTYGLVAPLWEQARVLAERLAGRAPDATYVGSRVSTKLKVAGVDLAVMGDREATAPDDEEVTYSEPARGVYKKLVVRGGKLAGAILLGDASSAPALLQAFDRDRPLSDDRSELLFPQSAHGSQTSAADQPDDAQICNCNGVSKGAIVAAVRGGCRSLKTLCDRTRAGTGCGSCKRDVGAILEAVAGDAASEDPSVHYYVPGVPLAKPELVRAIRERGLKSVSAVFRDLADGKEDPASKPGLASLLKTIWRADYEDERDARFINDRVHANIQRDATFSVVPRIYGGVTSPAQLRKIADVAERHGARMVKITGGQRIDLLGIPKERLPQVWRELGMPSGHAYSKAFRTCKTCVGTDFCRYGVGDSTGLGIAIEKRYQGLEAPAKLKLATAGCPRNCSEATTKDVGAVAIEGGRWEIYVGGGAGSRVRKGDLLCVVGSHEEVLRMMGRFMQHYRENARYGERTYDFVERFGIEKLRRLLVDDEEGIAARLDVDVQAAVDAYVDPWTEADAPKTAEQFTDAIDARGAQAAE
ncbi:MAG TPA: nitrite reductase large subunit NirB [Polyangiaceae bacterium]